MMSQVLRSAALAATLALGVGAAQEATAATLDASDVGTSFTVDFNYFDTLLAEFEWTLDSVVGNVWSFTVDIANNSSNSPNQNRLTSFGISATPDVSLAITDNDGGLWTAVRTDPTAGYQNIGIDGIEDCVTSATGGNPNCQGGGNGGIAGGGTSTMGLALTLLTASNTLTFDNFAVRYQSIDVNGNTSIAFEGFVAPVPLPAGLPLLGLGLGALALLRRRKA